ncbi:hypothetical protein BV898_03005 [Hypsibius exemplaris]|uniref:Uncharacterized protein n=1 Tax=Hypsibius exemplaris TaxID=2072580 RepID=A0A1W0X636_HYPEX|nr:hypothetical protein BV898_03005 [Hypsibius exemplaris]
MVHGSRPKNVKELLMIEPKDRLGSLPEGVIGSKKPPLVQRDPWISIYGGLEKKAEIPAARRGGKTRATTTKSSQRSYKTRQASKIPFLTVISLIVFKSRISRFYVFIVAPIRLCTVTGVRSWNLQFVLSNPADHSKTDLRFAASCMVGGRYLRYFEGGSIPSLPSKGGSIPSLKGGSSPQNRKSARAQVKNHLNVLGASRIYCCHNPCDCVVPAGNGSGPPQSEASQSEASQTN